MKPLRELLYDRERGDYYSERRSGLYRVSDYTRWLLVRLFAAAIILVIVLVPVVKFLMVNFEQREVTTGQAIIFIVQSLTTTGYGELLPFDSAPMIALTIILMITGVFIIFMIAGTLMASLVESSMVPHAPTSTSHKDHVIFAAFNEAAVRTIELLEYHRVPYVVAASDQAEAVELMQKGIDVVCADPRYDAGLKRLNVQGAQLVVANNFATENINISLGVANAYNTPVLAIMENETRARLAYAAGAQQVATLEETLGKQLVDWVCADASPTRFFDLIDVDVSLEILAQLKPSIIHVGANSEYCGCSIGDSQLRTKTGATIAAVWNQDGTLSTPSVTTIIDESTLLVLGPHDNVDRIASLLGGPGTGDHVVLVGTGRVGQEAGKRLNEDGITPGVIDLVEKPLFFEGQLILGDATSAHVLKEARIEEADTLIVTINDDSLNIFITLASRQLNPNVNIMARAVHVDAIDRLHQAGANHVLSESILGFQLLQMAMVDMGVLPRMTDFVIRQITWRQEPITAKQLAEEYEGQFKIIALVREEKVEEFDPGQTLRGGDHMVVLGPRENLERLAEVATRP